MKRGYLQRDYHRRRLDAEMFRIAALLQGQRVVDLGGERVGRRGTFRTPDEWVCVNIDPGVKPDVVADLTNAVAVATA